MTAVVGAVAELQPNAECKYVEALYPTTELWGLSENLFSEMDRDGVYQQPVFIRAII